MKIGIVYYSRSGNTKKVAEILQERLKQQKAEAELIEIEHVKRPGFFSAGRAALADKELPIKNTDFDLKKYDTILVGSPTWGGRPSPFIKSFFNKAENYKGKKAGVFFTSGGATEKAHTGKNIKDYLGDKGLKLIENSLPVQMRKESILDGEQNIDNFVETVMKK